LKRAGLKKRLHAGCAAVLIVGFIWAGWIWRTADDGPDLAGAYQIIVLDGVPQPIAPNESKTYMRDIQRYGGKTAVLFDEISRWWSSLWRGKSLALTVAFLTLVLSAGILLITAWLPDDAAPEQAGE